MHIIGVMTSRTQNAVALITWSEEDERLSSHITLLELSGPLAGRDIETATYGRSFLTDCITELSVRGITTPVTHEDAHSLPLSKYFPSTGMIYLGLSEVAQNRRYRLCMPGPIPRLRSAFSDAVLSPWAKRYVEFTEKLTVSPDRYIMVRGVPILQF
jgi:hypothetical protein